MSSARIEPLVERAMLDTVSSPPSTVARFTAGRAQTRRTRIEARRSLALESLVRLRALLTARGARRVWLFGSLVWGSVHDTSDIDLAVEGLPVDELCRVLGELLMAAPCSVDLIRIEEAPPGLAARIRARGRRLDD